MIIALAAAAAVHNTVVRKPAAHPVARAAPAAPMPDVSQLILKAFANWPKMKSDPFADASSPVIGQEYAGRSFRSVHRFTSDEEHDPDRLALWSFKPGRLLLYFSPGDVEIYKPGDFMGEKVPKMDLISHCDSKPGYVGQNAFGAKVRVTVSSCVRGGVAFTSAPVGLQPSWQDENRRMQPGQDYWVELPLQGPAAKIVSGDADLVVEGTIDRLSTGQMFSCKHDSSEPKIDDPVDWEEMQCDAGVKVTRVAFVRHSTGEIIKEWR